MMKMTIPLLLWQIKRKIFNLLKRVFLGYPEIYNQHFSLLFWSELDLTLDTLKKSCIKIKIWRGKIKKIKKYAFIFELRRYLF